MDRARHLPCGDPSTTETDALIRGELLAGVEFDEGDGHLIKPRVRYAHDLSQLHCRVLGQESLDLDGRDVLATDLEHVLRPALENQVSRFSLYVEVVRVQPAVA